MDLALIVGNVKFNYRVGLMIQKGNFILVECNPEIDFVTIPGGRVKTLESSLEAIKRELNEEMHIDLENYDIKMKALIENFFEMNGKKYHELYILYKVIIDENDENFVENMVNYDSKANYYQWVKIDDLEKVNLLPVVLRTLTNDDNFQNVVQKDL